MTGTLTYKAIEEIARYGSLKDLAALLQQFGNTGGTSIFATQTYTIETIYDGVRKCPHDEKAKKMSLMADYAAGEGIFKKDQAITPTVLQEFHDTIAQLTNRVAELEKAVPKQVRTLPVTKPGAPN